MRNGFAASVIAGGLLAAALSGGGCGESGDGPCFIDRTGADGLFSAADVQRIVAQAASFAADRGVAATIAVSDQQGNPLAIFQMAGSAGAVDGTYLKARTAAYFSTNGNAFTPRTASFIIQDFYPPGIPQTPAGPLFGVQFSSLNCSDIQRTGQELIQNQPTGLSGTPGGVPLYQGDFAGGGIGVSSGDVLLDESIALAGATGFEVPRGSGLRADDIFLDGFLLPFTEGAPPGAVAARDVPGTFIVGPRASVGSLFPRSEIRGLGIERPFPSVPGSLLSAAEVEQILGQAAERSEITRAAIRACGPARINISVVDLDGRVLGTIRTLDAPIFGFDVSVQKARTAVAFSDPNQQLGRDIRNVLGLPQGSPLAVTSRAIGFLHQVSFPPAVTGNPPGPFFGLQQMLNATCQPSGNGITVFPGGIPLYRGGVLVGAIGISGDGIEQDENIANGGTIGFEAPREIRTDQVIFRSARLPYFKEPRNPNTGQ